MRPEAIVVLGIGVVVVGLAPPALAQSSTPSSLNDSSVTLSGESLRTIESRTVSGDYKTFFNESSRVAQNEVEANVPGGNSSNPGVRLNDRLQIVVGDTLNSETPLDLFPPNGEPGDPQRVKLEVPLGQ
ncbi:MAG TPA: hypothetical protein DDZ80_22005 [Cyanobacteria bacterium UBA8803]|nr:hypothetical protein [Cyanobacteria bacterium UBA9273]HBL61005.1 hypothetical protein [Cyanobacteria bacterium UBA8803]